MNVILLALILTTIAFIFSSGVGIVIVDPIRGVTTFVGVFLILYLVVYAIQKIAVKIR